MRYSFTKVLLIEIYITFIKFTSFAKFDKLGKNINYVIVVGRLSK